MLAKVASLVRCFECLFKRFPPIELIRLKAGETSLILERVREVNHSLGSNINYDD